MRVGCRTTGGGGRGVGDIVQTLLVKKSQIRDQPWFVDQSVSIGRDGSPAHSKSEPSYTATLVIPNRVSTNATLHAAMAPPQ